MKFYESQRYSSLEPFRFELVFQVDDTIMDMIKGRSFSRIYTQLLAAFSGTLFAISDGMNFGWTAPFIPYLTSNSSHLITSKYEAEWLETDLLLGCFCGLPLTIYLVDKIGRKRSVLLATYCSLICWIVLAIADKMVYLHIIRFAFGMRANMSFVAAQMYVAEIANSKIRGFLCSIIYIMFMIGFVIVYSVGPYLPFYVTSVVGCLVLVTEISVFSFMPESPYYLLYKNELDSAGISLGYFRPHCDISEELRDITRAIERQKNERGRISDMFLVKSNRKAITIMLVLNAGQHLIAISIIYMNLHTILESAGLIYLDPSKVAILFSIIMLISVLVASFQLDKYGRKTLLLISATLTTFCLLALGIYFHLKLTGIDVDRISWIPIIAIMAYAATFKLGLGIVPIVITSELFPTNMKALGMTISDAIYMIGAITSVQLYVWLRDSYGLHVSFYLSTLSSLLIITFISFHLPETKGKTLEEIQFLLKGENRDTGNMDSLLLRSKGSSLHDSTRKSNDSIRLDI